MIEHITYYRLTKQNGKVKRQWLQRYYEQSILVTDDAFQQSFGINPSTDKDIVRAIKITKKQQEINKAAFEEWKCL